MPSRPETTLEPVSRRGHDRAPRLRRDDLGPVAGLTVLHLIARGDLDAARPITVDPDTSSLGPTGVAAFRHPATVAVGDLVLQMLTVSDNAAAGGDFALALDLSVRVIAKTGTFLHLRHEIGVIESISRGDRVALAALTRSSRRATIAHDIDLHRCRRAQCI